MVIRFFNINVLRDVLFTFVAALSIGTAHGARPEFAIAAAPRWVSTTPVNVDASPPTDQISAGTYYLLHDVQVRLEGKDRTTYRRIASKAINQKGLESLANIEVRFDPSYQTLSLHAVTIHRAGKKIEKLRTESVKILQRERDLEYLVYDGSKTANILLDDVQVGDTVEYAYSTRGNNPVFGGLHAGRFDFQWAVPVHQARASLIVPISRTVTMTNRNAKLEPIITDGHGERRYEWSMRDVPGLTVETDAPASYDPYLGVEWSEFANWGAVARWAAPLYGAADDGRAVTAIVAKLKAEHKTIAEQTVEALRHVQREIRYLSVAVGAGSHAPSAPQTVLERRFGDCKDKARLLVAVLSGLGVDAKVALVNTTTQGGVRDNQPSPYAFNHVVVRAQLNGQVLWLDPTRRVQGGRIDSLHQYDYGQALVIDSATTNLTPMFGANKSASRAYRSISAVIDTRAGLTAPAKYTVTSTLEGGAAESLRTTLSSVSRDDLQKQYLTFYDSYFPGMQSTAKFTVEDDLEENRIVTREFYEIPQFWKLSDTKKIHEGDVQVPDVAVQLKALRGANRASPLGLAHPSELLQTTEVLLPEKWQIQPKAVKVDGPGFTFERRIEHPSGNRVVLTDHFQSMAAEVAVADLPKYSASLAKARDAVGYVLTVPVSGADGASADWENINGLIATLAVAIAGGFIWLGGFLYRLDPKPPPRGGDPTLTGLRGWLIYVGFAFLVAPIRLGYQIWTMVPSLTVDSWANLTNRASETYHAFAAPLVIAELACNIGLLTLSIVLLLLFFKKRSSVPNFYIAFIWTSLLINALDLLAVLSIPSLAEAVTFKDWSSLSVSTVAAAVWSTYFKRSVRVRSTFVRTYAPTVETPAEPVVQADLRESAFVQAEAQPPKAD